MPDSPRRPSSSRSTCSASTSFPVLREEFAKNRPADVPEAPTHEFLVERAKRGEAPVAGGREGSRAWQDAQERLEKLEAAAAAQGGN